MEQDSSEIITQPQKPKKQKLPPHCSQLHQLFSNWLPSSTKSEKNKAILSTEQLRAIAQARASAVTPVEIAAVTGLSVYKIHKHLSAAKHTKLV